MFDSCSLFVVSCCLVWLCGVSGTLLVVWRVFLFGVCCLVFDVCCLSFALWWLVFGVRCWVCGVLLFVACSLFVFVVRCMVLLLFFV